MWLSITDGNDKDRPNLS